MAPVPFAMLELKFTAHASQLLTRRGGFYPATIDDAGEALIAALRAVGQSSTLLFRLRMPAQMVDAIPSSVLSQQCFPGKK